LAQLLINTGISQVRKLLNLIKLHSEALHDLKEFHTLWNDMGEKLNPEQWLLEK
jgi:hypothetical protein